ncbi:proline-rich protein 33 [Petaurus breviceps papuanus]|uniref:proline-rich protein 33 n=1 Tax=Petaurus breviceps papuanus TaxID=3040969 RepID=UPI0036DEEDB2
MYGTQWGRSSEAQHPQGPYRASPSQGAEMLTALLMPQEAGSPYPPALPPPLLPKPAKDNLRLQKLLKRAAKKKANVTTLQASSFRACLSPVSEASHDQDVVPQPCPKTPGATAPPVPPSPLALPTPPRILVPAARSPYRPVIQHVPSPLQKKSFSFSLTQQRSLAEHFKMTTPQFGVPGPDSFAAIAAPREVTHISQVHIHVGPVLSPQSVAPVVTPTTGSWRDGEQDSASTEAQERLGPQGQGVATPKLEVTPQPSAIAQIPVDHIQPLSPCPEPSSAASLPPSAEATAPKQAITKIVVPIAPTYRSPGPSQNSPLPRSPSARAEPCPVPPKPSTAYLKVAAASEPKQQPPGPSSTSSPEPPKETQLSSMLSPALGGEVPKAAPTPMPRPHLGGWSLLRKQLIVAPEAPPFPEPEGAKAQLEQASKAPCEPVTSTVAPRPLVSRATKMWDAVLYRMSVAKGGNQSENTKEGAKAPLGQLLGHGSFLPFLYRPRFDARKLREMAAQPPAKVNTVLGVNLRPSLAPKNFNRTAACWQLK